MKNLKAKIMTAIMAVATALGCAACSEDIGNPSDPFTSFSDKNVTSDSLYVKKVDGLTDDFIMGMDASAVISLEDSGVKYYDFAGKETDVFKVLADNGVNTIRVRVWNDPYTKNKEHGYGGGNNDIDKAIEIGKRATANGMNLLVDFHYSDFWADPNKQMVPKAWKDMDLDAKKSALYNYTKDSLQKLVDNEIKVKMVQIGNETTTGIAGESKWGKVCGLMSEGARAVREVMPNALVAVHMTNPEKANAYSHIATQLDYYGVDYDVFGSSYYPYWHGTFDNLTTVLNQIADKYNKKVMVLETSYCFTAEDTDFYGNTIGEGETVKPQPFTVQGQANQLANTIDVVAKMKNGIGVCYWEGTWISVGTSSYDENKAKWEQYGSGWAASYGGEYDPDDAGQWHGGCAVDNQAFFDATGKPLESLKTFALVKKGNTNVPVKAEALDDCNLIVDINGNKIDFPAKVNAVMTDGTRQEIEVVWDYSEDEIKEWFAAGVASKHTVKGTAGGMEAVCNISLVEKNYLTNYGFEDDEHKTKVPTGWTVNDVGGASTLEIEKNESNAQTGEKGFHFWDGSDGKINFDIEQSVTDLNAGLYKFTVSIMGGDAGENYQAYAYVKINGETFKTESLTITSHKEWHDALISGFSVSAGDTVTVGVHVTAPGGAWGTIDDALLNYISAE